MSDLTQLRDTMRTFTAERDWARFHDPKSLLLALVGEVGELAELMQWMPSEDVLTLAAEPEMATRFGEEISDVLLYLVRLADVLSIDVMNAAMEKMTSNARKHPPQS